MLYLNSHFFEILLNISKNNLVIIQKESEDLEEEFSQKDSSRVYKQ